MAQRVQQGDRVRVAYPAKSDPRSSMFAVYYGAETEGVVVGFVDEFSALVEAPIVDGTEDHGKPLVQYVAHDYLTVIESKES